MKLQTEALASMPVSYILERLPLPRIVQMRSGKFLSLTVSLFLAGCQATAVDGPLLQKGGHNGDEGERQIVECQTTGTAETDADRRFPHRPRGRGVICDNTHE